MKNKVSSEMADVQELISLIEKLNPEQKKTVLATLRGAVLIADSEKKG